ncbi:uncharacterized protein [Physcomitrium patens]|uniref:uncharacterized protein isoform X3 n=1 Tax=Physcomitrium patens TaxID=3218 RepID=UPI003CCCEC67
MGGTRLGNKIGDALGVDLPGRRRKKASSVMASSPSSQLLFSCGDSRRSSSPIATTSDRVRRATSWSACFCPCNGDVFVSST